MTKGSRYRVLIADDDPISREVMARYLKQADFETLTACDGREALEIMDDTIRVALFDLRMPELSGMECLMRVKSQYPDCQVIIVSGYGDVTDAVQAMKEGAYDYISKPIRSEELIARARNALRDVLLVRENTQLKHRLQGEVPHAEFVAQGRVSKDLLARTERIAKLDSTVLITGASGTGKSTVARMIHEAGERRDAPFVALNCASLPRDLIESELFGHEKGAFTGAVSERPGRVEYADGGTLFLDEIGDMPLELQPKLLTFLQDRTFQRIGSNEMRSSDVRVIAATHADLPTLCGERLFREDLYYRLNVLSLHMPALNDRLEDLPILVTQILTRIAKRRGEQLIGLAPEALDRLKQHHWSGNIRELENVLERASAFCNRQQIQVADLEFESMVRNPISSLAGLTLAELEAMAIRDTLTANGGNKSLAARQLGISEKSIYNKMKRHGMR